MTTPVKPITGAFMSGYCRAYPDDRLRPEQCGKCPGAFKGPHKVVLCHCACHYDAAGNHLAPPPSGTVARKTDDGADAGSARPSREGDDMTETTAEGKKTRALKADPIRDAIRDTGRVEVPLQDPTDAAERKRVVNTIFGRAYTLGLKGKFEVKVVDGVAIGQPKADA